MSPEVQRFQKLSLSDGQPMGELRLYSGVEGVEVVDEVAPYPEYFKQPNNHSYYHNGVNDSFDLTIHGNYVHQPKQDADHNECDDNRK
jgi:hypothetical protein